MVGVFFSLPISTAAANIFLWLSIIYAVYLILFDTNEIVNTFSLAVLPFSALIYFFIILSLSSFFMSVSWHDFLNSLNKYLEIILIPIFSFYMVRYEKLREKCLNGFSIALIITLGISYLRYFDASILNVEFVKNVLPKLGDARNLTVFKWHITHNFFMGFAVLFWGYRAVQCLSKKNIWFYVQLLLMTAALFNLLLMVQGRTGYIVLLCGILYFFINRFKYRGIIYAFLLIGLFAMLLILFPNNFHDRLTAGFLEIYSWSPNEASQTSMGLRLEFAYQSLHLFSNNWLFGVGLGNFGQAYGDYAGSLGMVRAVNPHNQYILFLVETGVLGFIAFLALNYVCWQSSAKLSYFWKHATRIVLLSYGVANLFNSFLFDFSESLFFSLFMALAFSELIKFKKSATKVN
jgi:O-antigen ligase